MRNKSDELERLKLFISEQEEKQAVEKTFLLADEIRQIYRFVSQIFQRKEDGEEEAVEMWRKIQDVIEFNLENEDFVGEINEGVKGKLVGLMGV